MCCLIVSLELKMKRGGSKKTSSDCPPCHISSSRLHYIIKIKDDMDSWVLEKVVSLKIMAGAISGIAVDKKGTIYFTKNELYRLAKNDKRPTRIVLPFNSQLWGMVLDDSNNTLFICDYS